MCQGKDFHVSLPFQVDYLHCPSSTHLSLLWKHPPQRNSLRHRQCAKLLKHEKGEQRKQNLLQPSFSCSFYRKHDCLVVSFADPHLPISPRRRDSAATTQTFFFSCLHYLYPTCMLSCLLFSLQSGERERVEREIAEQASHLSQCAALSLHLP